jgi:hypothetical protein
MFQIDLNSEGNLTLLMPSGCAIDVPATVGGLHYLQKVLKDHHNGVRGQRGYIGTLPTQWSVDKAMADEFLAQKRKKAAEEKKEEVKAKFGFDLEELRFEI